MKKMFAAAGLALALMMTPLTAQAATPRLSSSQAQAAALKAEPGTVMGKPALKNNRYSFTIKGKSATHLVTVDGNSGKILSDKTQK